MSGEVQIQFPAQFSHSVKIEQFAKGARVTVHIFANIQQEAIDQAIHMYSSVRKRLEDEGHILSPFEVKESAALAAAEMIETLNFCFHILGRVICQVYSDDQLKRLANQP